MSTPSPVRDSDVARRFQGKVATVTGVTQGIGEGIARLLVAEGASVMGAARRRKELDRLEAELGPAFAGIETDASREEDVARMVSQAVERFGRLDLGFNVVGGGTGLATVVGMEEADFDTAISLSLKSALFAMKHQARQMIAQKSTGAIVNISSLNARVPLYGGGSYACAKAAVDMLSRNAALELAPHGIRVNVLLPGLISTPAAEGLIKDPAIRADFMERIGLSRIGTVDEVAGPALFLASEAAAYVTGASLVVDGGWTLSGYPDLKQHFGL